MMNSRTKSTFVLVGAMMVFFAVIAAAVAQKSSQKFSAARGHAPAEVIENAGDRGGLLR